MALEFGPDWQQDFALSPYSLRFDLGDIDQLPNNYVTRFIATLERARSLARASLESKSLVAVIAASPAPERELNSKHHGWPKGVSAFAHLTDLGVVTDTPLASFADYFWSSDRDAPEQEPWVHRVISITWRDADILLCNQIAYELGVSPVAPVQSKLLDPDKGVLVHAYDDRGMDVTSIERSETQSLYEKHKAWLLDHDRKRMAAVFGH